MILPLKDLYLNDTWAYVGNNKLIEAWKLQILSSISYLGKAKYVKNVKQIFT